MARDLVSIVKEKMIEYYAGDSRRVHHFLKVHSFAKLIAEMEGMEPDEMQVLEIAALAHDIGIKNAELKYGYNNGKLQEQEGPPEARRLLREAGAEDAANPPRKDFRGVPGTGTYPNRDRPYRGPET